MHDFFRVDHEIFPLQFAPLDISKSGVEALAEALERYHDELKALLHKRGAILFRGFSLESALEFNRMAARLIHSQFDYTLGDSPRSLVQDNVYSSTDYPAEFEISLHQEMSYSRVRPSYLCFFCQIAPVIRGATPLANFRDILDVLPAGIVERFSESKLRYRRTLHGGLGIGKSWMHTFNTTDRAVVERVLFEIDATFHWQNDGSLRVEEIVDAIIDHPVTGEKVWFNQAEQWHPSALDEETRLAMEDLMPVENFPHYVEFADGTPMDIGDLDAIRSAQAKMSRRFDWHRGDLLLVDNVLVAHGRESFAGERRILVSLGN